MCYIYCFFFFFFSSRRRHTRLQGDWSSDVYSSDLPSREFTFFAWNNTRPLFSDARVRRAMTMGINRQQIIDGLLQGFGVPASGMIPPWSPMYTELAPLAYDPNGAKALLQQAGYADANGDGIREKGGQPLRFTLTINSANRLHS